MPTIFPSLRHLYDRIEDSLGTNTVRIFFSENKFRSLFSKLNIFVIVFLIGNTFSHFRTIFHFSVFTEIKLNSYKKEKFKFFNWVVTLVAELWQCKMIFIVSILRPVKFSKEIVREMYSRCFFIFDSSEISLVELILRLFSCLLFQKYEIFQREWNFCLQIIEVEFWNLKWILQMKIYSTDNYVHP